MKINIKFKLKLEKNNFVIPIFTQFFKEYFYEVKIENREIKDYDSLAELLFYLDPEYSFEHILKWLLDFKTKKLILDHKKISFFIKITTFPVNRNIYSFFMHEEQTQTFLLLPLPFLLNENELETLLKKVFKDLYKKVKKTIKNFYKFKKLKNKKTSKKYGKIKHDKIIQKTFENKKEAIKAFSNVMNYKPIEDNSFYEIYRYVKYTYENNGIKKHFKELSKITNNKKNWEYNYQKTLESFEKKEALIDANEKEKQSIILLKKEEEIKKLTWDITEINEKDFFIKLTNKFDPNKKIRLKIINPSALKDKFPSCSIMFYIEPINNSNIKDYKYLIFINNKKVNKILDNKNITQTKTLKNKGLLIEKDTLEWFVKKINNTSFFVELVNKFDSNEIIKLRFSKPDEYEHLTINQLIKFSKTPIDNENIKFYECLSKKEKIILKNKQQKNMIEKEYRTNKREFVEKDPLSKIPNKKHGKGFMER